MMAPDLPPVDRLLNGATSQADRRRSAPAPEKIAVDGRSIAQLLAFAAQYGALIRFYDLNNQPDGDWSAFFAGDPAVAAALHAAVDLPAIEAGLARLLADIRAGGDALLPDLLRVIADLLAILHRDHGNPADALAIIAAAARRHRGTPLGAALAALHSAAPDPPGGTWPLRLDDIIDDVLAALIAALDAGMVTALADMTAALQTSGHEPQAALYNAFVLLFAEVRQRLNHFPHRLVDWYFSDILKQNRLAAEASTAFLAFTPKPNLDLVSLPRGSSFSAGNDAAGLPINFATESALAVVPVSVTGLAVVRGIAASAESPATLAGLLSGDVDLAAFFGETRQAFPLFGAARPGPAGAVTMAPASLGFTIASPVLMLTGGARQIIIGLSFTAASLNAATALITGDSAASPTDASNSVIAATLHGAFALYYSSAAVWVQVTEASVTPPTADTPDTPTLFTVTINLPADAPPLVALATDPASVPPVAAGVATAPPGEFEDDGTTPALAVRFTTATLPPGSSDAANSFQLLSALHIAQIALDVTVTGFTGLTLTTPAGPASTTQSFALLGSPPVQNGRLRLTAAELFVKPLASLSVSIAWAGLPVTTTGFQGYYQGYVIDADGNKTTDPNAPPLFDNASFQASFSLLNPGFWTAAGTAPIALFQTAPATEVTPPPLNPAPAVAAPVLPTSLLTVTGIAPVANVPAYYDPATSALLLTLVAPSYAFGNILYSSNLMAASIAQSSALASQMRSTTASAAAGALGQVANAAAVNASAPAASYASGIAGAIEQAIAALTGDALAAARQAVAMGGLSPAGLEAALAGAAVSGIFGSIKALFTRIGQWWHGITDGGVSDRLTAWLTDHMPDAGSGASAASRSQTLLQAADMLRTAHGASKGQPAAVARPQMAAAIQQVQGLIGSTGGQATPAPTPTSVVMPNPPWLPMATAVTVNYTASALASITVVATASGDIDEAPASPVQAVQIAAEPTFVHHADTGNMAQRPSQAQPIASPPPAEPTADGAASPPHRHGAALAFRHLQPFNVTRPWLAPVSQPVPLVPQSAVTAPELLPVAAPKSTLMIQLSAAVPQVSLLVELAAGPNGWWQTPPNLAWQQQLADRWIDVDVLADGTDGMARTGVITLALTADKTAVQPPRLRISTGDDIANVPNVTAIIANAVNSRWIGPGGAATLGVPLPPGSISKANASLAGIATIDQPQASIGGRPPAIGPDLHLWLAERTRHKGFAVDQWDYARIILEAVPMLWQVAIVPATDAVTGAAAAGKIWVVVVAGPRTPNVTDPSVPVVDPGILSEIKTLLEAITSAFAEPQVSNPPWLRLQVTATLAFDDGETSAFWIDTLQSDLIAWLSPWPDARFPRRPANYYRKHAIAEFIRGRAYVRAIIDLDVRPDGTVPVQGHYYCTSAASHCLTAAIEPPANDATTTRPTLHQDGRRPAARGRPA